MKTQTAVLFLTVVSAVLGAAEKSVPPTEAQMRNAYDLVVKDLMARSKYPTAMRIPPIEKAWFMMNGGNSSKDVVVFVVFDGQNGLGAMVRSTATCFVSPDQKAICVEADGDREAQGLLPKGILFRVTSGALMTDADVIKFKEAGFSDDLIIDKIANSPTAFRLELDDMIVLRKAGISDSVIGAMLHAK